MDNQLVMSRQQISLEPKPLTTALAMAMVELTLLK